MNVLSYKVIFSKRLGTLVAVGEHASAAGKSASGQASRAVITSFAEGFVGALRFGFATVALACLSMGVTSAQSTLPKISSTALPQGSSVNSGSVAVSSSGSQMALLQTTDKASVNWQSFNIGSNASVNIVQPSASAVMLNRVVGNDPSQILGKLSANGQVILLNPNGIAFGKDGSVTASSFTASTFALSEQDFAANVYKYQRNGSTAQVVNQGTIQTQSGGFVALVGASVTNEGKITAPQGDVVLAAAESVTLPAATPTQTTTPANVSVRMSKRVRLEVAPAAINTAVNNAQSGVIVTEGGQVLMQAASLSDAVASVTHSGRIDTTAPQAGAVTLLADGGQIKVSGSIKASSKNTENKGGDIVIGRDEVTGVLAKTTDVSGAILESQKGFIETSGDHLVTNSVSIKAAEWLLDPSDITISTSADSNVTGVSPADITPNGGTGTSSVVQVSTIQNAINAGTNVTIKTTNASNATGAGNITIANALAFANNSNTDATLSLIADNGITQSAGASLTTSAVVGKTGLVNVSMTANGNYQGVNVASANSAGIVINSAITTNGAVTLSGTNKNTGAGAGVEFAGGSSVTSAGAVTVNGTSTTGTGYGVSFNNTLIDASTTGDISVTGTSAGNHGIFNNFTSNNVYNLKLVGKNVSLNGSTSGASKSGIYSYIGSSAGNIITAAQNITITGTANGTGTASGLYYVTTNWQNFVNSYTAGGSIALSGTNTAAGSTGEAVRLFGVRASTTGSGNITVNASTQNAAVNAINIYSAGMTVGFGYQGGATSLASTSGDVKIQTNQGGVLLNDGVPNNVTTTTLSGRNISIDNTGGSIDAVTGVITKGAGYSSSSNSGVKLNDARALTATGNLNLYGVGTSGSGVEISAGAALSAANININGENTGSVANTAAINITSTASTLSSTAATTLTSGGVGSGTSLLAAGNIAVGTQLKVTTPAAGTVSGLISGNGSLLKMGAGQTKLTAYDGTTYGTNTFTGGTTISQGTLLFGNGNGAYNKTAGAGTFILGDANTGSSNVALLIDKGKDAWQAALSRAITVSNNGTGTATIGGAAFASGSGWTIINSAISLNRDLILTDATSDRLGVEGALTGTGNITVSGSGSRITMSTAQTFTGDITITAGNILQAGITNLFNSTTNVVANGELRMNNTSQVINTLSGASTGKVTQGGTLTVNSGGTTFAGVISGSTSLVKNGSNTLYLTGTNTYTGTTTLNAGTLHIGNGGTAGTLGTGAVSIAANSNLNFYRTDTSAININNAISSASAGAGTINFLGSGVINQSAYTLGGNNSNFSGSINLTSSRVQATSSNQLGTAGINVNSGSALFANGNFTLNNALTLAGNGWNESTGYLGALRLNNSVYAGNITLATNARIGAFGSTGTVSGVISGAKNLEFYNGTVSLTNTNTYTGTTTITGGTLQMGTGGTTGSLGTDTGAIANNGTLAINHSDSVTIANVISGTGALTQAGTGTTILTGTNSYSGATSITAGTLQIGNGGTSGTLGTNTGAIANSGTLTINHSDNVTIANVISGTGALTQAGSGTTTLTGTNTYSGATTISAGTLQIGNAGGTGSLGNTTGVTLSNSANLTFSKNVNTAIDKAISGNGNVTANITGDLALTSTIALTGTNTINLTASGAITETAGSLAATNLYMTATNGGIGATGNRIQSNVTNLSFSGGGDVFVTEANAVTVSGRTTANNGSIDVVTTNGSMSIGSVNSINGITANGTGNITLTGNATTGNGISISNVITASNGDVNLTGTTASTTNPNAGVYSQSTVTAKNITMVARATATTGAQLGYYGAGGNFDASQLLSLTGTTNSSANGLYSYTGRYASGTGMTLVGSSSAGQAIGFDAGVTVSNTTSGGISMTGTATDSTKQALGLRGVAITNGGGNLSITATNGKIFSDAGNPAWGGVQTNTITNSGTGAVQITAGNGSATNSGSIDGSVFTITQNGNAGVVVSTSGTGNVTAPKIINAGTGDIVVAAGTSIAAGTVTGGQILTVANNTLTQTNVAPGKTYVYSGSADTTGVLSNLSAGYASLYYQGTSQALNAGFNQGFDANHANDMTVPGGGSASSTQVFFRSTTKPGFSMTLANASKAYGDTDPTLTATNATLTNAYAGIGGNNSFAVASVDVVAGLTGSRAAGENVGTYAYTLSSSSFNTTLAAQPNLVIGKRDITLATITASNKTYNGYLDASITSGTFGNIYNNETLAISGAGTFSSKDVANGKTVTVADTTTLTKANGTGNWSNYNLTTTSKTTTANITKATLTATANADAKFVTQADAGNFNGVSYSGFVGGDTSAVVGGTLSISRTNALTDVAAATYTGVLVPTGLTASNYNISYSNGNYTIVPADRLLVNTTSQTVTYGTTPTFTTTAKYLDSHDNQIKVLTQTGTNNNYTYNDGAGTTISLALKPYTGATAATLSTSGNTVVGTYDVKDTAYVQNGTNFNGTPVFIGTVSVAQKSITPSASGVSKVYDGTTATGSIAIGMTGKVTNDAVTISGTGAFTQKDAGANLSYSVSGIALAAADAGNYYLSGGPNSITANDGTITAKALTLTASSVANKVYDGSINATVNSPGTLQGLIGTETLTLNGITGTFASAAIGSAKPVTVAATLADGTNGGLASNYTLSSATAFADITSATNSGGGGSPVNPPKPIIPNESSESANASNFNTAGENNLLVIPALRPTAESCTPTNLEDCLCETQETRAIEGIQICYQPKKTASTTPGVGRKS